VSTSGRTVDLNADVGERSPEADDPLVSLVTTVHIACGFHAGDPATMRHVVERAVESGVAVGAHPSYPDREGLGRREMDRPAARVAEDVLAQVGALDAMARWCGTRVVSVKAHGALYHRMATDEECAGAVAEALSAVFAALSLVLPAEVENGGGAVPGAAVRDAVTACGLAIHAEGFCDRGYRRDGSLVGRAEPGALITEPERAARQACSLALEHTVETVEGEAIALRADTLCIHGDTPGAPAIAAAVRHALESADVRLTASRAGI
jgi:UPF0271 protein